MKRKGNLYYKIYDMDNLRLADKKARRGKSKQKGVIDHIKNEESNLIKLHYILRSKSYKTSEYINFKIFEDKERDISSLPFFPDRIAQHAIANVIEPILTSTFTADSYSAIKGRGIHKASYALREAIKFNPKLTYCLKIDIKKFYPSVKNEILKQLLRKKFKDKDVLNLLDEIIDSSVGLPLGNYLSQSLANFYLTYFDHWLKENKQVKHMFRYCDDICILTDNKPYLHKLLYDIKNYLSENLELEVKDNYQIFPIASRSIDFVGYCVNKDRIRLRKSIKKRFAKKVNKSVDSKTIASYNGWIKHCDGKNLIKKLIPQ